MPLALWFVAGALLVNLTLYVLTGGADYGSGVWDLFAIGPRADAQRELLTHSIGPVWEADHVWLILAVVILFNGFPIAFARIMTAMHVPVTLMLIGVVMRGSAFSFRSYGLGNDRARRRWGRIFAIASLITPLLLGVIIGAIAAGRVPATPYRLTDFITPWMTPFCFGVGLFALAIFAYLAAVYAAAEAVDAVLAADFRIRAIVSSIVVGLIAGAILLLSINGAPLIWNGLTHRVWTWPIFWLTTVAALAALWSLWTRRLALARICAAAQVALILWGWALAQYPYLLEPDLTIFNASAPPRTLEILASALVAGAAILLPSYGYLLRVFKRHRRARAAAGMETQTPESVP